MRKNCILLLAFCLLAQWAGAQSPKWAEKAKRAVFSVVTYDGNNKILNTGNGFFVSENGVALSDYSLFKGAARAIIINSEGTQMPVEAVMGADDMYDVIKFRVAITGKKVPALAVAETVPEVGNTVYLLPYSTEKGRTCPSGPVKEADKVSGDYRYYTLNLQLREKRVSCPLMTAEGKVFALAQKAMGQDTATICYGVDARFALSQTISPLSINDMALNSIGIKKALPDTEEQALVYLFMASSQVSQEKYAELLENFIAQYPNCADGYMRRAAQQLYLSQEEESLDKVVADMDKAVAVGGKLDDIYYNRAKMIYNYLLQTPEDKVYKEWSYDKALQEIGQAIARNPLPVYVQLQGDIHYAKQDFASALQCYETVNKSELASPATFFSAARAKEMLKAPMEEVLALVDSCMARFPKPYTEAAAPYLLERARYHMEAGQARQAVQDYNAYYTTVNGKVNDVFYYMREQAALKAKQYQRALDDLEKAIELNPTDLTYRAELAVVNIRVGRNEEALKVLEAAKAIDPNYSELYRLSGLAYIQMKDKAAACNSFAKAKELGDPNVDELIERHCK